MTDTLIELIFYLTILTPFAVIAYITDTIAWAVIRKAERSRLRKMHDEIFEPYEKIFNETSTF
jgi:hypothetical protein